MSEEIKKILSNMLHIIIKYSDDFDELEENEIRYQLPYKQMEKLYDYITSLQQKVEQLEKENIKQKEIIENLTTMTVCGDKKQIKNTAQYKLEQLENIKKEIKEYIEKNVACFKNGDMLVELNVDDLLNILNKGSESNV